ncbi:MAG TPA: OpgC domain-containing protein [Candidatus Sulfotelmatobacter sp.]|nr:OpgC domain-containing protein [Candidatus Sulfotelmatobacter sp.]
MALPGPPKERELRLDFFRGLALIFIFLDHIPSNLLSWLTVRNFGFSDATEIFIFISGYTATVAYGGALRQRGFVFATLRILRRCWQLYAAHVFLFMVYTAQIAYVAATFRNPMFVEEMNITSFLDAPHIVLVEALLLRFMPANMDVLPLYIVLLLAFPLILAGIQWNRPLMLAASLTLYVLARRFDWNLTTYPDNGGWFFNPFAWQLLFVFGSACGRSHGTDERIWPDAPWLEPLAILYLLLSFAIVSTWHVPALERFVPDLLQRVIYPIDKTSLDPLRLLHFLALAFLTVRYVPSGSPLLRWRVSKILLISGRQSLHVFCLGIFLSFAAHFVLEEIDGSIAMQIAVSVIGIALMTGLAWLITAYQMSERQPTARTLPAANPAAGPAADAVRQGR